MNTEEARYAIALEKISGLGTRNCIALMSALGSATAVYANRHNIVEAWPEATRQLQTLLDDMDKCLPLADKELEFDNRHGIRAIAYGSPDYPRRLLECPDAPPVVFYRGNANLNVRHIISIVGTRRCTDYGREFCQQLIGDISQLLPDTLVVSGLAYGIDINAHRASLAAGLPTIAVLAHGLDRIYPPSHRETARHMLDNGGLLTEYTIGTNPDRGNFVRRNRIIAGLADASIVVESAEKGGGLITASLAFDYNRQVFALPGRTTDKFSKGCNNLIAQNKASLLTSAAQLLDEMGWEAKGIDEKKAEEGSLFPRLTEEEQAVVDALQDNDGKQLNQLVVELNMPVQRLSAILFTLEMQGVVRTLAGGIYKLSHRS